MPPQNQRRSSSAEDLDEYLKFQQGQQAKQAMSLQQLGAMFNMSQQQVANEIARANLEIARSGQGIAQERLNLDIASNPSIIAARAAEAAYNQARADGLPEEQASLRANRAAQTAQIEAQTKGQLTVNKTAEGVLSNQATALEQANRAGESSIALADAQTRNVGEQRKALEYTNLYGAQDAKSRSNLLSGQDVKLTLENSQLPTEFAQKAALTGAQIAQIAASAEGQGKLNADFERRVNQDITESGMRNLVSGSNIATQGYNNIWQDLQNQNALTLFGNQDALAKAQIQNIRATTGFGAFDRGLVNGMQAAELTVDPSYYDKYIRPIHEFKAKERETTRLADEARQAQSRVPQTFKVADQPADLQPAYAEEVAKVDAFYKAQQIQAEKTKAIRDRNASLHQLNLMRFSDTFDPGSSY